MTTIERLEKAVALLSKYEKADVDPSGSLTEALGLVQGALDVEKANENLLTNTAATLSIANGFLRDVVWLMNSVPNFSDGARKSYDMARDINAFLREQKK